MSRLLKSSGAVGAATLISRVLGFAREAAYANFMGVGAVADAFYYAYSIPSLFRRLLGEGALTAAFLPVFKERDKTQGSEAMWQAANAVISALILSLVVLIGLAVLGITAVLWWAPMSLHTELILRLLRLMFPYLGFVCVAAVFIGMLNSRGHYFVPALGASVLNLVMIASVFYLTPWFGASLETQVFGLGVGVVVAGVLQAAVQWPLLRREGFRYRWVTPWRDPTVREVGRRMAPATLGVAAYQINVVLTQTLAVTEAPNIVSAFNYAVRLMELPQGVVGVSLATYLLAELSGLAAEKKFPEFRAALREGLLQLVFINAFATVILLVLARPMLRLLFQHGNFTAADTELAAQALWLLAPGLLAFSLNNIFARAFYALGDTTIPMRISLMCLAVNLVLAFFLIPMFRQAGMGLANTLSAVVNTALLVYALRRKLPKFGYEGLGQQIRILGLATLMAAGVAWGACAGVEQGLGVSRVWARAVGVFGAIGLAGVAYFGTAWALGLPQAREMWGWVIRSRPRAHS